ncbi:MAG: Eco57I restriction-modification methylase domain-containing protein [Promethearchaeota archaeon]
MEKQDLESLSLSIDKKIKRFENEKVKQHKQRKDQGAIYTPKQIVDFMIIEVFKLYFREYFGVPRFNYFNQLISFILKNQIIKKGLIDRIPNLKFLDPACGTGRFLISIAKKLAIIYKILYPDMLDFDIKKTVIERHLFGIDIENSALKIAKLRLTKWLFSEVQDIDALTIQKDNIDQISNNCGINFNFYNCDFLLDFNLTSFDFIIGNPPYIENKKILDKNYKKTLKDRFNSAYRLYDLSILFIEKALEILRKHNGILSFLTTNKFLAADYGIKIRQILIEKTEIREIIDVSSLPIFFNVAAYPVIITLKKKAPMNNLIKIKKLKDLKLIEREPPITLDEIYQNQVHTLPDNVIPISNNLNLVKFLYKNYKQMVNEIPDLKIVYRPYGFINWSKNFKYVSQKYSSDKDLLLIGTGNVGKFHINFTKPIRIAQRKLNICYFNHNDTFESKWKELSREKLIFREIAKNLTFSYDPGLFTNITGLYFIIIPSYNTNQIFSLLLILNSELINRVFKTLFGTLHMAGDYMRINGSFIKRLPMLEMIPTSFSGLGKTIQFLSQLKSEFKETDAIKSLENIDISFLEKMINFYDKLSNAIINGLYLKKSNSLDYKILSNSIKNLPKIRTRYFSQYYRLSKHTIYSENERESTFNSILDIYNDLKYDKQILKQIEKFQKLVMQ